ncbi:MAG: nucleotidyltransferase family protein [Clostridia bacterium]|nr:nucleotidyltransferase family protein [Clostridia bacterium]
MDKICGIICEFNPLHEGHIFLINEAKKIAKSVVCVMSGNFVQRGEAAFEDKYSRAKSALGAGADAVLELPFPWCAAPAEFFARAGVAVAHAAGVTDLVFGSECGDTDTLLRAAELSDSDEFKALCEKLYQGGVGFAAARYEAARRILPDAAEVFNSSNDMLAAEYIRQSKKLGIKFDFHAIERIDSPSATEIRKELYESGEYDPSKEFERIEKSFFRLGMISRDSFDSESGIIARLEKSAVLKGNFLSAASTKKYTNSRLRRAALFAVTGVKKADIDALPEYTVLLAAFRSGRKIVKDISGIETVTKPADAKCPQYVLEEFSDKLYTLCMESDPGADYFIKKSPYIIDN